MNESYSFLYEWTSPNNVIVLREHDKPTLTLIGIISHESACYEDQCTLDIVAEKLGLLRPVPIDFKDIFECRSTVMPWKGKEGVVIYSPCGQILKKFKATEYLDLHRLAAGLSTIGGILETYLNGPEYFTSVGGFYAYVEKIADFEIASRNEPLIKQVIEAYHQVLEKKAEGKIVADTLANYDFSIAEKAKYIAGSLNGHARAFAFNYMHQRPDEPTLIKRAMKTELGLK